MWRFIRNHRRIAAFLLVMLLGGGLYGGLRLFGAAGGESGEWTTLNGEVSEALARNERGSLAAKTDSAQGREQNHQEGDITAPTGTSLSKQKAGLSGDRNDASKSESGTGIAPEKGAQGQEQKNAGGGTEAGGNRSGGGSSNHQQAGNSSGSKSGSEPAHGLVNLNTASVSRLTDLPGIGESKARAIVEYRKQSGGFHSREELMKVKGIGQKTFDKLKELITVSP